MANYLLPYMDIWRQIHILTAFLLYRDKECMECLECGQLKFGQTNNDVKRDSNQAGGRFGYLATDENFPSPLRKQVEDSGLAEEEEQRRGREGSERDRRSERREGGREGRKGKREGGREGRKGEREGGKEGREGERKGRQGEREGGREGRERGREGGQREPTRSKGNTTT